MADTDLPLKIKHVIRTAHGKLNRLNTARIPLCLPPQAKSPALYALGLSRYAEIYLELEDMWHAQVGDADEWMGNTSYEPDAYGSDKERVQAALRTIYLPELLREKRLEADLAAMKLLDPSIVNMLAAQGDADSEFRQYLKQHVSKKPHLLVAYIWIMYQALLNGGLFIRAELMKAGPDFWGMSAEDMDPTALPPPLSFWCVEEASFVKDQFKECIISAEKLLTEAERREILEESPGILRRCELITLQLDEELSIR
ncbi:heme-binding peroxidase [Metarhizium rileyi]|uniref:Heme oxygenase n=1 Tax=Metarhizium rileyi (strain RCEF 4871) TaxID=1649241 RepID=A0A166Y373_METRR|nr:heme-binding peroxidase [Metarhizium rileyi RCEF 4871]TWU70845.1 heme oxygenase [Metarhizium rileyi]